MKQKTRLPIQVGQDYAGVIPVRPADAGRWIVRHACCGAQAEVNEGSIYARVNTLRREGKQPRCKHCSNRAVAVRRELSALPQQRIAGKLQAGRHVWWTIEMPDRRAA